LAKTTGATIVRITNNANLPESVVSAVSFDDYDYAKAGDISASGLSKSPRQRQLEIRHRQEIVVDAADLIWKLIGNIGHKIVERAAHPNTLVEERMSTTVLGWVLAGKCDLLYENGGYGIDDFKFTSVWAMKDEKQEWSAQLNTYAWLAKQHGFDIKRLRIIAVLRDWSKMKAARESDYPPVGVVVREVPLWSVAKQADYIWDRVRIHQMSEKLPDDYLPDCTDDERLAKPDTFAVKKKKTDKRAVRVLPSIEDAMEWAFDNKLATYHIEHRRGSKTVRCDHYCDVKNFCNQYRALKSAAPAESENAA
jgi:hypothetical protein